MHDLILGLLFAYVSYAYLALFDLSLELMSSLASAEIPTYDFNLILDVAFKSFSFSLASLFLINLIVLLKVMGSF
jgi:hypothetical protein